MLVVMWCFLAYTDANSQVNKSLSDSANLKSAPAGPKYEMKQYWFVMLTKGEHRITISVTAGKNSGRPHGQYKYAGKFRKTNGCSPFGVDGNWGGIFILDCKDKDGAEKLLQTDPVISSGRIHPWWTDE